MILDQWNAKAFLGYAKPLEKLERSLNKAGRTLTFHAFVDSFGNKMVKVIGVKIICIEGASPAQAVKYVAAGVEI